MGHVIIFDICVYDLCNGFRRNVLRIIQFHFLFRPGTFLNAPLRIIHLCRFQTGNHRCKNTAHIVGIEKSLPIELDLFL